MTSDAPELLPCPFCGGEALTTRMQFGLEYAVGCTDCDMAGSAGYATAELASSAWNTRTDQQTLDAAREEGRRAGLEEATEIAQRHEDHEGLDKDGNPYVSEETHLFGASVAYEIKQEIRALAQKEGE